MQKQTLKPSYIHIFLSLSLALCPPVALAALSGSLDPKAIAQRLKPIGQVNIAEQPGPKVATAPAPLAPDAGKKRYEETCSTCHAHGMAGAPKWGDKAAWDPRIAQGEATLLKYAIHGLRAMPPKGGCIDCSEEEIKMAVEYMLSSVK